MKVALLAAVLAVAASQYTSDPGYYGGGARPAADRRGLRAGHRTAAVPDRFPSGGTFHANTGVGSRFPIGGGGVFLRGGSQQGVGGRGGTSFAGYRVRSSRRNRGGSLGRGRSDRRQNRLGSTRAAHLGGFRGSNSHGFAVHNNQQSFTNGQHSLIGAGGRTGGFARGIQHVPVRSHSVSGSRGGNRNVFFSDRTNGARFNAGGGGVRGVTHGERSGQRLGNHLIHGSGQSIGVGGGQAFLGRDGGRGGRGGSAFFGRASGGSGRGSFLGGEVGGGGTDFHAGPSFDFSAGGNTPLTGPAFPRTFGSAAFGGTGGGSTYRGAGPSLNGVTHGSHEQQEDDR